MTAVATPHAPRTLRPLRPRPIELLRLARPLDARERAQLARDFVTLCEIESPSRRERPIADLLVDRLRRHRLAVHEDASAAHTGSNAGNVIARWRGSEASRCVLLGAHMDTVPPGGPIDVVLDGGRFRNRHPAVLGADNKAAVACLLGVARRLERAGAAVAVEMVFTTCEELAVCGARHVDAATLHSEFGFVFDRASPLGEVVVAAPDYYAIEADFLGRPAHAGSQPEHGRSAIAAAARALSELQLGRLGTAMTANAGTIEGGSAINVVPERCRVVLEARSLEACPGRELVTQIVAAMRRAAAAEGCDVRATAERKFDAYRLPVDEPPVSVAATALRALGFEPRFVEARGGSDASAYVAAGIPCVNVANETERDHRPDESVTVHALETTLELALEMLARSAHADPPYGSFAEWRDGGSMRPARRAPASVTL
jgi:tripeptide aminopeptidase